MVEQKYQSITVRKVVKLGLVVDGCAPPMATGENPPLPTPLATLSPSVWYSSRDAPVVQQHPSAVVALQKGLEPLVRHVVNGVNNT